MMVLPLSIGPPPVPMIVFAFLVRSARLVPPEGVVELEAPTIVEALKMIAANLPGVHVVRLEYQYSKHIDGATA